MLQCPVLKSLISESYDFLKTILFVFSERVDDVIIVGLLRNERGEKSEKISKILLKLLFKMNSDLLLISVVCESYDFLTAVMFFIFVRFSSGEEN